ncbi:hypothetical protein PIB30_046676 [Stylosanthes scabra]|uniref:Uncharacterized protein n=1 Tax=Stylosanthes scabra TaxID=79078 RepID=A0ABU6SGR3_9FABA|nr:hypothetical protein [Stylosanthes scabra]
MEGDESFLALVHRDGKIRYKTREGVKFIDKSPTNVFITPRATLLDLQRSIIRKLGLDGRKRVSMIYYRIPIFVVALGVKYGCFAVEGDDDLQILFHCRRQYPEVQTTELFVEIVDPIASSGGSAPNPRPVSVGGASGSRNQRGPDDCQVASPSFDFNFQPGPATGEDERAESRSAAGLGVAVVEIQQQLPPSSFEVAPDPDPYVGDALIPDDSDDEPQFIEGDSDEDVGPVPPQAPQAGASSSGTQQYPPHLSNLNLEALSGPGRRDSGSSSGAQVSQGSNTPAEFHVGQSFHSKEEAVIVVKNYNIR